MLVTVVKNGAEHHLLFDAGTSPDGVVENMRRLEVDPASIEAIVTWMQDRESGVFLAATSNNITVLPPEMIRKGRFDEIFFVDLPSVEVRAALFELHLKKRGRDATTFICKNLPRAATASRERKSSKSSSPGFTPRSHRSNN